MRSIVNILSDILLKTYCFKFYLFACRASQNYK